MARRLSLSILLVAIGFMLPSESDADDPPTVHFGFYPSHNRDQLSILADEFCSYLSHETDYEVVPYVSRDYDDLIDAIDKRSVDFAWLSPLSFVKAEKRGNARVLLKSVRGSDPFYYGAILVRKDRNIRTIQDLNGKRMGWTYPSSTAGYMFTKAALYAEGIDTDAFFSQQLFLGGHDELVKAVMNGDVDGGACFANDTEGKKGAWTQYLSAGDRRKVTPIFFTKPIPGDTITGSKSFIDANPKVTNRILKVLLDMGNDSEGKQLLTDLYQVDYLVDAEKDDYQSVREASLLFPDRR